VPPPSSSKSEQKSIAQVLSELWELLRDYAKQETVEPLKGLGRYIGYGLVSAVLLGVGNILLTLALLRVLQTHTDDHLTGSLTWVPYAISLVFLVVLVLLCVYAIKPKERKA
jgi:uncharacterized BrkB/YihY/UPF0761 family membrane protein